MKRSLSVGWPRYLALLALLAPLSLAHARDEKNDKKAAAPPAANVNVTVTAGTAAAPPVSLIVGDRNGHVTPSKAMCSHTGGGLIDVASPSPDVVIITMTGIAVRNASMRFDLDQRFEISYDDPKTKKAKLTVEARVVGLLRGEKKGCAEYDDATVSIGCAAAATPEPAALLAITVPPHSVCGCGEALAVNDHGGPRWMPAPAGKYNLHQTFHISAHTDSCICKGPSAEFAPDPALDPLWINYWEPFHGVKKDSFGFQVILKVAADTEESNGEKKAESNGDKAAPETTPAPKLGAPKDMP
jgi:hypothetical protein